MTRIFKWIVSVLIIVSNSSLACTCIGTTTVKKEIKTSDFVFIGKVISKELISFDYSDPSITIYSYRYKIEIDSLYKGEYGSDTLELISGVGKGDCGFVFQMNESYIVYANYEVTDFDIGGPSLSTNICRRTTLFNKEELDIIRSHKKIIRVKT